ncbi:MAG: tripartite tricarboxylate transporter substrate binding protein [Burkholderiales bacterium]|nr:tripartite tricarboxylate transporter substrate binding protein [Burkholderiales bacterium]
MRYTPAATRRFAAAILALCAILPATPAVGQSLTPGKPVRLILPYTPGGPVDVTARILAESIPAALGVPLIVENRPGANGKIAAEAVVRAEPDGHTLMYGGTTQYINLPILDKTVNFRPFEDFRMVSIYTNYDIVFMAGAATGIRSMRDLLARMKNPAEDVIYASIAQPHMTPTGLAYLIFAQMYKGNARHISYPGQAPGMIELMAGRVHFATYTLTGALQHIQSGKIVALATASPQRLAQLPDVPTMAEAGFPEFMTANNWVPWIAIAAPARTPDAIVDRINRAIVQVAHTDAFKARLAATGLNLQATGTAAQDQAAWRAEYDRLGATLKRFNITLPEDK